MQISYLRRAEKFIEKCNQELKDKVFAEIFKIYKNPKLGKKLKGQHINLRAHRFRFKGNSYRIAYRLENGIVVVYIAGRENFYNDL